VKARGLFCIVTACLFFPGFLFAQNLVKNSGFNSGTTSWNTSCSMEIYPETAYGGPDPGNQVTEIDIERCFNQDICVADNTTYTVSLVASRRVDAPPTTGFRITITGDATGITYVQQNVYRTNATWLLTPETFTFTIPAGSADKTINMAFTDIMLQGTYGVILDNIEIHPAADMTISGLIGSSSALLNTTYSYSVLNSPANVSYSWSFDAGSTPGTSTSATPSVSWSTIGTKSITVAVSNDVCTIATLSTTALVTVLLPTQVTSFTGNITSDDKAILRWTANNESTNHFVLERSANGTDYQPVAVIFSDSTAGLHSYSYTDAGYFANAFYRLKLVDVNGHTSYSQVVIIKKNITNFAIYPSTAATVLHYSITAKQPAAALVQIMNAAGQTVITQKDQLYQGVNAQTLDVSKLPAGSYFLRFSIPANNSCFVQKFNKL
jgi:hypothetical protein